MNDVPEVGTAKYLPNTKREGRALCLSGGGFRATLFHLGAVRRLNELGVLHQLDTITSVSGGSILAAQLATSVNWPLRERLSDDRFNALVAHPIRRFTQSNRRTSPLLHRLKPWNWLDEDAAVQRLADVYKAEITHRTLSELPAQPIFKFLATDMAFGAAWVFERERMGSYQAGYLAPPPNTWTIAKAVAASSCFPPVFNPMQVKERTSDFKGGAFPAGAKRDRCLADLRLTDGGNYDNLGLEPVWKDHELVLASDGGAPFDVAPDEGLRKRFLRYIGISENQSRSLRKRWLISGFVAGSLRGTYWGVGGNVESYRVPSAVGYSKELARDVIGEIRTDLNAFSEAEAAVLENHGYTMADAGIRAHVPMFYNNAPPPRIPHPEWMDEERVAIALRNSNKR